MTGVNERLIIRAEQLVAAITDQAERDAASYRGGYEAGARDFFFHGCDVGYARAEGEAAAAWREVAGQIRGVARAPERAELERRRSQPSGPAYNAAILRHGGTEYAGRGRPRVPAPAGVYEAALARFRKGAAA